MRKAPNDIWYIKASCYSHSYVSNLHDQKYIFFLLFSRIFNHRMVKVGKDLCRSSGSTPLLKQDHLQQVAQTMSIWFLKSSKDGDPTASPGNLCQTVLHHHTMKKCFLMFRQSLVFQFVPIASHSVTGHHWKEHDSVLFAPSLQLSIHIDKISWTLSSPGWTVPTLSCEERWSSLFIFLVALLLNLSSSFLSLLYWGDTRTGHSFPGVASAMLTKGEGSPDLTCWQYFA